MPADIVIRYARSEDAAAFARIYEYYVEKTAVTFDCTARSVEGFEELIDAVSATYPFLVAEIDGAVAGYAYAARFRRQAAYDACVELSIYLDRRFTRTGIGTELYAELERRLRDQGITNLYACISYPNEVDEYLGYGSVRFHEHLGFKIVGLFHDCGCKFGRTYSMVWMEKLVG